MNAEQIATISGWVGRSYARMNCWELIRAAYRLRGVELPANYHAALSSRTFRTVFEPEPGDLIPICNHRLWIATHVALYLGEGRMIHSVEDSNVVIQPLTKQPWWDRISREREGEGRRGYLRLRGVA